MTYLPILYQFMTNPLDDETVFDTFVKEYATSFRFDSSLYSRLFSHYSKGGTFYNYDDINQFYSIVFNIWKKNVEEPFHTFFEDVEDVRSIEEIEKVLSSSKLKKKFQPFLEDKSSSLTVINSSLMHPENGKKNLPFPLQHQLFVNVNYHNIHKLGTFFLLACEEKGIPYFFKMFSKSERDDSFVAFVDDEHLDDVIQMLDTIIKENPELSDNISSPPILTGKVTPKIGYSTAGQIDGIPFNSKKCQIIQDVFSRFYYRILEKSINFPIKDENGHPISLIDQISWTIVCNKVNYLTNLNSNDLKTYYGLDLRDLKSTDFLSSLFSGIKGHLTKSIPTIKKEIKPYEYSYSKKKKSRSPLTVEENDFYKGVFQTFPLLVNSNSTVKSTLLKTLRANMKENGFDPYHIAFDKKTVDRLTHDLSSTKSEETGIVKKI